MGSSSSYECRPEDTFNVSLPIMVPFFLYDDTERIIITIVNPIILGIGLIGNLAFLFVLVRIPRMRTITNIYLANLSIADITFLSIAIGEKLGRYFASPIAGDHYPIGQAGCRSIYTIMNASYFASLYLITMVTLEKYYAICKPIQHRLFGSKERSYKLTAIGWIIAYCFSFALLPGFLNFAVSCVTWPKRGGDYSHLPEVYAFCRGVDDWAIPYVNGIQTIPFILTFILNIIMYVRIILTVRLHTQIAPNNSAGTTNGNPANNSRNLQRTKIRNQVTRMVVINGVIFFVFLAPFQMSSFVSMITMQIEKFLLTNEQYEMLFHVGRIMTYINCAVNPYVYTITNARYRQAFKEAFCKCFMAKSRRHFITDTVMEDMNTVVPDNAKK